jgi:hypothetical protein
MQQQATDTEGIIMGNRAVITFDTHDKAPCIYLHWNGGRASVDAFLAAAKHQGITLPDDMSITQAKIHAMDALAKMIAERFFNCEVGVNVYRQEYGKSDRDNWDNGTYVIDPYWDITQRLFQRNPEEVDATKSMDIYNTIINHGQEVVS